MTNSIPDGSRRKATISGLREMTDFLEANPGVPDNGGHGLRFQYSVSVWFPDQDAGTAEVDRVAKELGVEATWNHEHSQYSADRAFGPHLYMAVYCVPSDDEAGA